MSERPKLRLLADRAGILPGYVDCAGIDHHTTDTAREALLAAMGFDASTEEAADSALGALDAAPQRAVPVPSPAACVSLVEKCRRERLFGIWANLYTVRGTVRGGLGDLRALHELVDFAADSGASFVGINPLHATRNIYPDISPYRALSRVFHNPIYLDVSAIPEMSECDSAPAVLARLAQLDASSQIDYDSVWGCKRKLLEDAHRVFARMHRAQTTSRGQAYAAFLRARGDDLRDFATFMALDEQFRSEGLFDWRRWPAEFRDRRSREVSQFRTENREAVDFHSFLQFELDRQLGEVAEHATASGLPIGLFCDLAIGTAPDGADPWLHPELFVHEASIGAPPDDLAPQGQDWSLAPVHPFALKESGYRYWIDVLQGAFRHAGALRVDHVMGLQRQFWIPKGYDGRDGAYVAFPADDLFAILAAESRRHNALVVGEDLGTVPHGFADVLSRWGILSTRVLYFERDAEGEFGAPGGYSNRALTGANTHDLAPLAGFWTGRDLGLRREVGQLRTKEEIASAEARRESDRQALLRRLRAEELWQDDSAELSHDLVAAIHAMLSRSPAPLVGVSLDDLALEEVPVNLPGIGPGDYPSWTRRMSRSISELRETAPLGKVFNALSDRKTSGTRPSRG